MKKVLFIVNKKAGTGKKKKFPSQVNNALNKDLFSYDIAYTQFRGHAVELAADAAKNGVDIIAAVGGDGSVNEVTQGILGTDAILAVIPAGSGNGLARSLGIPCHTEKALAIIDNLHYKSIDVGFANDRLFLSNAGVGFDALVARLFAGNKGRGLFNYTKLVLNAVLKYHSKHYHLMTDSEEIFAQAFFVAAANGNQFGYDFKIAPEAKMDDGLLDICILKPIRWWHLPAVSLRSLSGKLTGSRFVTHLQCRTLTLRRDEKLEWMQVDGDALPVTDQKVQIRIEHKALSILVPAENPGSRIYSNTTK